MPRSTGPLYVGLMSGTSLDGVDAVVVELDGPPKLVATHFVPYPVSLKQALLELHVPGHDELNRAALLANEVSALYADAALEVVRKAGAGRPAAVGCHGQTVRHRPDLGYTLQLANGALIAERTGIDTVVDFRSRDIAAGGEGAPLVPAFHAACFRDPHRTRVIVNMGGIANVTLLPPSGAVSGFDTGPGNLLLDAWARSRFQVEFDRDGAIAARGRIIDALLAALLEDEYFDRPPPKSTGRDHFNESWLARHGVDLYRPEDVQATLAELTVLSITRAITRHCDAASEVYLCGGGAHNRHLASRLAACLPGRTVGTTAELGIDPDWVEAAAFAWLAQRALLGESGNVPEVTGAAGPRILGAVYRA